VNSFLVPRKPLLCEKEVGDMEIKNSISEEKLKIVGREETAIFEMSRKLRK